MNSTKDSIQVSVRCRPLLEFEKNQKVVLEVHPGVNKIIVRHSPIAKTFSFDKVFGPETGQERLYEEVAAPLIKEVLMGFNCTIFAYGQTGTGKTFTIEGYRTQHLDVGAKDSQPGLIPRAMTDIFNNLEKQKSEFHVGVSFLELYNEEIFDLLTKSEDLTKLKMFDTSSQKSSVIRGLEVVPVSSISDVYAILERGYKKRRKAATLLNTMSSRSHTIFTAIVDIKEESSTLKTTITGKLNLVDLAGSENIGRSGAVEKQAREAGNINQSLLALGRVIAALCGKAKHIPYRQSKLTRLLRDSLGGQTKTTIIATVSPSVYNIEETLNTLNYALKAKNILNKPEVNTQVCPTALTKDYLEEISKLQKIFDDLCSQNGHYVDAENWRNMNEKKVLVAQQDFQVLSEIVEMMKESAALDIDISETERKISINTNKVNEEKEKKKRLLQEVQDVKEDIASSERMLAIMERYSSNLHDKLHEDLAENFGVQAEHKKAKKQLSQSMSERKYLSEKLQKLKSARQKNLGLLEAFKEGILKGATEFQENVSSITAECTVSLNSLEMFLGEYYKSHEKGFEDISSMIVNLENENASFSETLNSLLEENKASKLDWILSETHSSHNSNTIDFEPFEDLLNGCEKNLTMIFVSLKDWKENLSSKLKEQQQFLNSSLKDQINLTEALTKRLSDWIGNLNGVFEEYCKIVLEGLNRDTANTSFEERINAAENAISSLEMFCNKNAEEEFRKHLLAHLKLEDFTNIGSKVSSNMLEFCDSSMKAFNDLQENLKSKKLADIFPAEVQKHTAAAFTNYHNLNIESSHLTHVPKNSEDLDHIPKLLDDEDFHAEDECITAYCKKLLKTKDSFEETFAKLKTKMESFTSEEVTLLEKLRKSSSHCYEPLMAFLSNHICNLETHLPQSIEPLEYSTDRQALPSDSKQEDKLQTPPNLKLKLSGYDVGCEKICPLCNISVGSEALVDGACSMSIASSKNEGTFSLHSSEFMSLNFGKKVQQPTREMQRCTGRTVKEPRKRQGGFCPDDEILKSLMMKEDSSDEEN